MSIFDWILGRPLVKPEKRAEDALVQQLRVWEAHMTPQEMDAAFQFVRAHGWAYGDMPPPYVWAAAYWQAAPSKVPARG